MESRVCFSRCPPSQSRRSSSGIGSPGASAMPPRPPRRSGRRLAMASTGLRRCASPPKKTHLAAIPRRSAANEQNPYVHYLLYHDRNPRLHHCSQFYHVPICETDASMACAASNGIGVVSAMDAHALFIKCNPYHPHRVVWSGRQQVEFELRFPSSSILRS